MPVGTGTPVIPQAMLDLGPARWFRPEAEVPPGNQVRVKAGYAYAGAQEVVDQQADQLTAGFASVASGAGFKRYDMVYIDSTGAALIAQGRDVALANPLFDGAPGRPNGPPMPAGSPVAFVLVDEVGAVTVDVGDVYQINGFIPLQRDLDGFLVDKGLYGAAPVGTSINVSAMFASETRLPPGTGAAVPNSGGSTTQAGVITSAPLNYVWLLDQKGDQIKHTTGAECYGRLTEAAGVWTLSFYYTDAAGAEQTMDPSVNADVAPTDLRLVGVAKVFSRHDPARPLFDSPVARLSDQVVGDIPVGSATQQGKLRIATDGSSAAVDMALGSSDARSGAVKGRANAGAVSGFEQIVRLIAGSGITVALAEAGGELQFTITATGSAPGGLTQQASTSGISVNNLSVNPGFEPRLGFVICVFTIPFVQTNVGFGVFAGTPPTTPPASRQLAINAGGGAGGSVGYGPGTVASAAGWVMTSFTNANVACGAGTGYDQADMLVLGGA